MEIENKIEIKKTRITQRIDPINEVLLSVSDKPEVIVETEPLKEIIAPKTYSAEENKALNESSILTKARKEGKLTEREIAYLRAKGMEPVRGIFHFWECQGGTLAFDLIKFKNTKPDWSFVDGEERTIPLYVAQHLNNSGFVDEVKIIEDPVSRQKRNIKRRKRRYSFESLEFLPKDVIGSSTEYEGLSTVESAILL